MPPSQGGGTFLGGSDMGQLLPPPGAPTACPGRPPGPMTLKELCCSPSEKANLWKAPRKSTFLFRVFLTGG